ncbi:MAG TPA: ABC transporter ATP-binding protein [Planctomycetota bacterium]|nr:ABC transporter ATP-binding protein [Planctomycetota bacterium]
MKNLIRALKLILPHRGMMVWYVLTALGLAVVSSAPLVLVKTFLDKLEHKAPKDKLGIFVDHALSDLFGTGKHYIYGLCVAIFILWTLKALFDFLNNYISAWLAQRLRMEAIERVMHKLLRLDEPFFDKQKVGDLVSRMVSDGDNLRKTVKVTLDFLRQPFQVISLVAVAVYYDPLLFAVGAVGLPLVILPVRKIIQNITRQTKKYQEKTAGLAQAMLQNLIGIRIIHAYDAAELESQNFSSMAQGLFRTGMRRNLSRSLQRPLIEIMLGIGLVGVLIIGGLRSLEPEGYNASNFIMFVGALGMLYGPIRAMMGTLGELAELIPSAERTFEILDVKPTICDAPDAKECPQFRKEIVFENVSFDYGRGVVLKDLNLTIRAGEKIGIVGRTGVGKSTLLSLLLRFYDASSGRILIDGEDIRAVKIASLRSHMALVAQNPFLFHATVAENIRYGRPGASDDDVIAAAKAAMIHDEIIAQPEGYQTLCGERGGELFSGGQRQRIAVARAILRNAPILLLDEATSALDPFSERRVQDALDQMVQTRTSLIVAHRLSTLRNVDRILVFADGGGIEAIGPHEELLRTSPTYARLWKEQQGSAAERPVIA